MYVPYEHDTERYVNYYISQAGGDLSGYSGASSQYGSGIGGIFRGLFRTIMPLMKRGFAIAKPHLKTAGKGILSDVITRVVSGNNEKNRQEGSGMIAIGRRAIKRPPGNKRRRSVSARRISHRNTTHKKRRSKSVKRRVSKKRRSTHRRTTRNDIF